MKLALGTAQLGMDYGIANQQGQPSLNDAFQILSEAHELGIEWIDTASAYGESEKVIGQFLKIDSNKQKFFKIVTKLKPNLAQDKDPYSATKKCIEDSLTHIGIDQFEALLFHRWSDRQSSEVLKAIAEYKNHFKLFGVSVGDYQEAIEALKLPEIAFIQIPYNVIDWRAKESGFIDSLNKRTDVHIQARSILLQGLLTGLAKKQPYIANFNYQDLFSKLSMLTTQGALESNLALAYSFANQQTWMTTGLLAAEKPGQLTQTISSFANRTLPEIINRRISELFNKNTVPENLLNPAVWKFEEPK